MSIFTTIAFRWDCADDDRPARLTVFLSLLLIRVSPEPQTDILLSTFNVFPRLLSVFLLPSNERARNESPFTWARNTFLANIWLPWSLMLTQACLDCFVSDTSWIFFMKPSGLSLIRSHPLSISFRSFSCSMLKLSKDSSSFSSCFSPCLAASTGDKSSVVHSVNFLCCWESSSWRLFSNSWSSFDLKSFFGFGEGSSSTWFWPATSRCISWRTTSARWGRLSDEATNSSASGTLRFNKSLLWNPTLGFLTFLRTKVHRVFPALSFSRRCSNFSTFSSSRLNFCWPCILWFLVRSVFWSSSLVCFIFSSKSVWTSSSLSTSVNSRVSVCCSTQSSPLSSLSESLSNPLKKPLLSKNASEEEVSDWVFDVFSRPRFRVKFWVKDGEPWSVFSLIFNLISWSSGCSESAMSSTKLLTVFNCCWKFRCWMIPGFFAVVFFLDIVEGIIAVEIL